jgi:hypothetical protein
MTETLSSSPPITGLLQSKGRNTLGHETNLARSPIWHARPKGSDEDTVVSPVLFGHPFRKVEGARLTTTDQRLFAHLTTAYVRTGCPDSRQVPFSLGEAAITMGHDALGGRQRSLIRSSLGRLRSVTFESAVRHPDGNHTVLGWGLLDGYLVTTRGGGKGWVKLSETVAQLLREGSVTFLHAPTWEAICAEDEVAGRLWSFLESENIGSGWRYSLFAPASAGNTPSSMPSIAQILQLNWTSRQRRVAQRVREACTAIERHDPRYRLTLATGSQPGTWVLTCMRNQAKRRDRGDTIPDALIRTWRECYRSHVPSRKQRSVLVELLTRRSAEWITGGLEAAPDGMDPFGYVLELDRSTSARDLDAAKIAEARWDDEKQRESSTGEQSLMELLGTVAKHFEQSE